MGTVLLGVLFLLLPRWWCRGSVQLGFLHYEPILCARLSMEPALSPAEPGDMRVLVAYQQRCEVFSQEAGQPQRRARMGMPGRAEGPHEVQAGWVGRQMAIQAQGSFAGRSQRPPAAESRCGEVQPPPCCSLRVKDSGENVHSLAAVPGG